MSIRATITHGPEVGAGPSVRWRLRPLLELLLLWDERHRTRRHLLAMDDRMLRDVGLGRSEATTEAEKPFWRA